MDGVPPLTRGRLLVASPDLGDANFRRTVVLMIAHDDEGAVGLVLNRPSELTVAETLPAWRDHTAPPATLYVGGPVQPDAAIALGRGPSTRGDLVIGDLGAVDLDGTAEGHDLVRVFVGYSGWGPGQLEGELARDDWLVVDALVDDVVTTDPDGLWRDVLRRQRGRLALFANAPDDASVN
jgi:putative transcriptional regulator